MASYRDFEMLNSAISDVGEGFARRKQQGIINEREAQRIAMERDLRTTQAQRESRMETEGNRRFDLMERRQDRIEGDAQARAEREEKRLDLANQPHVQADVYDEVNGTSMTVTGTPAQIEAMQAEYQKKTGKPLRVSNKKDFAATFNVGGAQFSFMNPEQATKFAEDMKAKGIDVYKASAPQVTTTPGGMEIITDAKGRMVKGASAPDPGYTTIQTRQQPPDPFSTNKVPTVLTNITTRLPAGGQPAGKKAEGGYKIGARYKGGLKYLGGDPNDQSNWERAE